MFWILLCIFLLICLYFILIRPFKVWIRRGVPQHDLKFIWTHMLKDFLQLRSGAEGFQELYKRNPNDRYTGIYQFCMPAILLRDPNLIRQITVKDADHFIDHTLMIPADSDPLWENNLFALRGDKWREMRATLSPSFTSSKMKFMFGLIRECADQFSHYFEEKGTTTIPVEMKDVFARFTNDVIASAAFGITCDSLRDGENDFYKMGKIVSNPSSLKFFVVVAIPRVAKLLGIKFFGENIFAFFKKVVTDSIAIRERKGIVRPDLIHLLMQAKKGKPQPEPGGDVIDAGFAVVEETETLTYIKEKPQKVLTEDEMTSQAFVFFLAGFHTVSSSMCFTAYELAINPDMQEKLQREIDDTLSDCGGTITYEALMKMKYIDMVVSESLRKWPPSFVTDRVCVKSYTIEPERPGENPIHLREGESVTIPTYAIHRDPAFFPEPERFDPERFSEENKPNINPYTYIPFGTGPRACIGCRFALMEMKTLLCSVLSKFDLVVIDKTVVPLKIAKSLVGLTSEGGFWLGLKRRRN